MQNYLSMYFKFAIIFALILSCKENGKKENIPNVNPPTNIPAIIDTANPITMDKFIGANAFVDDPIDKMTALGFIREYHLWGWDEGNWENGYTGYPKNQMAWAPSKPGWNFDEFYKSLLNNKIEVSPCIQNSVAWLNATNDFKGNDKPLDYAGANPTDPNAYQKKAHHMFQFAARYGATKVNDNKLTLAAGQPRNSGLGLIKYVEDWNEQDKDWMGKAAEFSPEEYAAMASADYDGHCNTMQQGSGTFGVKNADSNIKLVMGGLAGFNLNYIKRMKAWFEANRKDKKFAADVINLHIYAWKDGNSWQGGGPALSPEDAKFKERATEIVDYRNKNLPGKEVWISEFGWDTNPGSPLCVPKIGNYDYEEVQGQWLIRAYLAFAAAGVDRAQMFSLRDGDPADPTWFSSSGLIGPKGNFAPKKSWYYVNTMKNILKNTRFEKEETVEGNSNLKIYHFKNITDNSGVLVVWSASTKGLEGQKLSVTIPAANTTAEIIELDATQPLGRKNTINVAKSPITIDISERPVFISLKNIK